MAEAYRELDVWQCAIQLSVAIYKLTSDFPKEKICGLTSRLRRAGVSVASNLAEGYGRSTRGEYRNFPAVARELGFADVQGVSEVEVLVERTGKMLWAMRENL